MKNTQLEEVREETVTAVPEETKKKKWKPGKKRRWTRALALLVVAALAVVGISRLRQTGAVPVSANYQVSAVTRQDLSVMVSGSGTLVPADSYQVSTLISGTIESAPFEEDDLVEKGKLLYTLDSSDAQGSVERAGITVEQAELGLRQAMDALRPVVPLTGTISEVMVHNGDSVTAGTALAKIVASTELSIDFLFINVDPSQFYVGQPATVFAGSFEEPVQGTVSAVSDSTAVTSNGKKGSTVRVKLSNPGVLSDSIKASAVVGSYSSYGQSSVNLADSAVVYASGSGTVSGFEKLVGSTVEKGEVLCTVDSESIQDQIAGAELSLRSARLSAGSASESLDDYRIESPISGTVIEKNFKAGDKVDGASSGTLAVIYDLSYLKVEMDVNELDIGKVAAGQTVKITAAALPGEEFEGVVERVSINGSTTNGFTTYPVTIVIRDYGGLKPGMNVSADILCQTAENALCVPVAAVSRGNIVLVPGEGAMSEDGGSVADPEKLEERTVTLGFNDEEYIEITSGLAEGDVVLIRAQDSGMGG